MVSFICTFCLILRRRWLFLGVLFSSLYYGQCSTSTHRDRAFFLENYNFRSETHTSPARHSFRRCINESMVLLSIQIYAKMRADTTDCNFVIYALNTSGIISFWLFLSLDHQWGCTVVGNVGQIHLAPSEKTFSNSLSKKQILKARSFSIST